MGFSKKQAQILAFPKTGKTALICDGAVRTGKTSIMSISFILWMMGSFNQKNFAFCGRSVQSVVRNIIQPLSAIRFFPENGYLLNYAVSKNLLVVERGGKTNYIYVFGGKDESSYTLIQGITLAGVLLDEVALMPRSFVEQALARCSVDGSRYWFSCNPEYPQHWFYQEWILDAEGKNAMHLHFRMEDNPGLSAEKIAQYQRDFQGPFYERYVLGHWVRAEGLVYPMFDEAKHVVHGDVSRAGTFYVSIDYGTVNPTAMGLWRLHNGVATMVKEYYFDSRKEKRQKTDEEYYADLERFAEGYDIERVIVDPSAASFKECMKRHGRFRVWDADNAVLDGIRLTGTLLQAGRLLFQESCTNTFAEFGAYMWDDKRAEDAVVKENDHSMDQIRYFCNTVMWREVRAGVAGLGTGCRP